MADSWHHLFALDHPTIATIEIFLFVIKINEMNWNELLLLCSRWVLAWVPYRFNADHPIHLQTNSQLSGQTISIPTRFKLNKFVLIITQANPIPFNRDWRRPISHVYTFRYDVWWSPTALYDYYVLIKRIITLLVQQTGQLVYSNKTE